MNKNLYLLLLGTLMSAACTNNLEDINIDPSNKTAISFVGQNNMTRAGFTADTQIAMHIRSTKDASNIRETRTFANALTDDNPTTTSFSTIEAPSDENVRYWDDAFGRDAKLSVFAVAVPGKTTAENNSTKLVNLLTIGSKTWNTEKLSEEIAWTVSTNQTSETIANEDLTYSNNISENGTGGAKSYNYTNSDFTDVNDGCLQFRLQDASLTDGPGKCDQGNLKFTHALSRITVNLKKGTGYENGSFSFATGTNVKILGVPTTGSLDIEDGTWSTTDKTGISKMATTTLATGASYSLVAQVLPGYEIKDNDDTNVLEFIIDDNKYFVTQDMMLDALNAGQNTTGTSVTMGQGKNYVFTITVGKSKIINVTATLEPWVKVEAANHDMDNSHIEVGLFKNKDGKACGNFDLYRLNDESQEINTGASEAKNWKGNYTETATLTQNGDKWETNWFFENNKSFYHFRTVDKNTTIEGKDDDNVDDYFVITSGAQDDTKFHWGAPFVSSTTSPIKYDKTNGYTGFLSPAIGATNSTINLTELHMRSNINVVLRTTKTSNAVALEDGANQCVVSLTYFYDNGKVNMGNGLVTTTGSLRDKDDFTQPTAGTSADGTNYIKTGEFTYAVVPQTLVRNSGSELYVGITIKTPDNNQYYVVKSLAEIAATSNGSSQNQTTNSKINFWYPNHSYTYTFTLTKAGIKDVTCTVEDWINVTADNKDISLED